jgi:two-component system sensor histidine kinase/response regulator
MPASQSESAEGVSPEPRARPRILAVDDQRDALRPLQMRLQSAGMECFTCSDGPAALAFLAEQPVDVVILDVMMPIMDGFEVCRQIKANERTRDIPVLFLTAGFDPADRILALEIGGHDYLNKPVDLQELLARTRAAVRVKQLQDQLKEQLQLQQRVNRIQQERLSEHWAKTLGQLAASLAHEINNPLAAALGNLQLLELEEGLNQEMRQRLDAVENSLRRASDKFRSLLLIAQASPQPQDIPLAKLVEDLVTLTNFAAVVNKVSIITQIRDRGEWRGSPAELARAALYVLNNAIEAATGRKEAAVTLSVQRKEKNLCLHIANNGPGIPAPLQGRVFEPFFTTKGAPHTGVGLYLAAQIVTAAGGHIEFQSPAATAPTEFTISLPAFGL